MGEPLSPDIFEDLDFSVTSPLNIATNDYASVSANAAEPEPMDNPPEWQGVPMEEIRKGFGPFDVEHLPPISPSSTHTVLFMLPLPRQGPPKPYPSHQVDKWHADFVRLPQSSHSLYPYQQEDGTQGFRRRWEVIQEALLQSFYTSRQLECAISSYNHTYAQRWDFKALHHFFSAVTDEHEAEIFFETILPKIIRLALQLPELVTGPIPLLKKHVNATISLSQLQVAALLANAFLCTLPRRNSTNPQSEFANYPYINFNRLFGAMKDERQSRSKAVMEKLKCIFHYFRRVTSKAPEGTITIKRKYIPKEDCPKWEKCEDALPALHITSKGTIESEGAGLLQVDFANKFVGGGVLHWGCVQEEIRFMICPELLVSMLVTEALDDTEALVVCGVEQYSKYEGYGENFKWGGDYVDETPKDSSGRRKTCIVAIDAMYFSQKNSQFDTGNLTRELNKAYVGFVDKEIPKDNLSAIATGNWGCGAFRGNPKLKVLLQLMAAAAAKRSVVYFTFGDTTLRENVAKMYWHLVGQNMNTAQLFSLLSKYQENASKNHSDFYRFLYNKGKMKSVEKAVTPQREKPTQKNVFRKQKVSPKSVGFPKLDVVSKAKKKELDKEEMIRKWLESSDEEEDEMEDKSTASPRKKERDQNEEEQRNSNRDEVSCSEWDDWGEEMMITDEIKTPEVARSETPKTKENQMETSTPPSKTHESENDTDENVLENIEKSKETPKSSKKMLIAGKSKSVSCQRKISDFFSPVR